MSRFHSELKDFPLPLPLLNPPRLEIEGDTYERDCNEGLISILDAKSDFVSVQLSKDGHLALTLTDDGLIFIDFPQADLVLIFKVYLAGCCRLWSCNSGRESRAFRDDVVCVTFLDDFSAIFTGSSSGDISTWNVHELKRVRTYKVLNRSVDHVIYLQV